jgi:hypothetical protein
MKQITLSIPDDKVKFFMELIKSLNFIKMEEPLESDIPEQHKIVLEERIQYTKKNLDTFLNWDEVKKEFE